MTADPAADSPGEASKQMHSTAGMTTKVVKGSMWTLAGQVAPLAVSLVTTPFVIRMLGVEMYGVFTLMNVILAYVPLADFGMSLSSTDFAARAHGQEDWKAEADAIQSAFLIALAVSTLVAIILVLGAPVLVSSILQLPESIQSVTTVAIYVTSLTFTARVLSGIVNSPQLARLRMDLNSLINTAVNVGQIVTVPVVLFLGGGIIGAVIAIMVFAFVGLLAHITVSARLLPSLLRFSVSGRTAKALLRSGLLLFVCSAASLVLANFEKFALTRYVSVSGLAYYGVAFTMVAMLSLFAASMSQAMLPAFSQLLSKGLKSELEILCERSVLYSLAFFAPAAAFLLVAAGPIFTIWAGEEFGRESTAIFRILLVGILFAYVAVIASTVLIASRKVRALAILYWCEVPPYLGAVVLATSSWGVRGAAAAWSLRAVIEGVSLWILMKRSIGSTAPVFQKRTWRLAGVALGLISASLAANWFEMSAEYLIPLLFTAVLAFWVIFWKRILLVEERSLIREWLLNVLRNYDPRTVRRV